MSQNVRILNQMTDIATREWNALANPPTRPAHRQLGHIAIMKNVKHVGPLFGQECEQPR